MLGVGGQRRRTCESESRRQEEVCNGRQESRELQQGEESKYKE